MDSARECQCVSLVICLAAAAGVPVAVPAHGLRARPWRALRHEAEGPPSVKGKCGVFEGFVTRHTEMPLWLSLTILLSSLTFIIWYVIIYPAYLNRKNKKNYIPIDETTTY